jgi:hypothetical protein
MLAALDTNLSRATVASGFSCLTSRLYVVWSVRLAEVLLQERKQDGDDDDSFETFLEDGSDLLFLYTK